MLLFLKTKFIIQLIMIIVDYISNINLILSIKKLKDFLIKNIG